MITGDPLIPGNNSPSIKKKGLFSNGTSIGVEITQLFSTGERFFASVNPRGYPITSKSNPTGNSMPLGGKSFSVKESITASLMRFRCCCYDSWDFSVLLHLMIGDTILVAKTKVLTIFHRSEVSKVNFRTTRLSPCQSGSARRSLFLPVSIESGISLIGPMTHNKIMRSFI